MAASSANSRNIHLSPTNNSTSILSVDVSYVVMGGREKNISMEFITPAPQYEAALQQQQQQQEEEEEEEEDRLGVDNKEKEKKGNNALYRRRIKLRDVSIQMGRCTKCGSLHVDCDST